MQCCCGPSWLSLLLHLLLLTSSDGSRALSHSTKRSQTRYPSAVREAVNITWYDDVYPALASARFPEEKWLSACVQTGKPAASSCCRAWNVKVKYSLAHMQRHLAQLLQPPTNRGVGNRKKTLSFFQPAWNCSDRALERVPEKEGDGPKWVCGLDVIGLHRPSKCLVYSVGSAGDTSFEEAVKKRRPDCEIFTFDPTLSASSLVKVREAEKSGTLTFLNRGLASKDGSMVFGNFSGAVSTLHTIVRDLGHTGREIDILKVDIESSEFDAIFSSGGLRSCMAAYRDDQPDVLGDRIGQVQIEVHAGKRGDPRTPISYFWANARAAKLFATLYSCGLMTFSEELNIWGGFGGYKEFSLVSSSQAFRVFANKESPAECSA